MVEPPICSSSDLRPPTRFYFLCFTTSQWCEPIQGWIQCLRQGPRDLIVLVMSSQAHPEVCFTNLSSIKCSIKTKHLSRDLYIFLLLIDTDLASDSVGTSDPLYNRKTRKCCKEGSPDMTLVVMTLGRLLYVCSIRRHQPELKGNRSDDSLEFWSYWNILFWGFFLQ